MVPHVFNPSTWKGEAGRSLGSRLFRATKKKKIYRWKWLGAVLLRIHLLCASPFRWPSIPVPCWFIGISYISSVYFFFYYVLLTIQEGWGKDSVSIVVPIQTQAWLQHTLSQEYPMSTASLHMHVLHTGRYSYVFHLIFEGQGQGWAVWSLAMISLVFRSIEK